MTKPKTFSVASIEDGGMETDGSMVRVRATDETGKSIMLEIPYDGIDHISQGLLALASTAYDRRIRAGVLPVMVPQPVGMIVEGLRTVVSTPERGVIVQLVGRQTPTAPLALGSFLLSMELARDLAARLQERLREFDQRKRPS